MTDTANASGDFDPRDDWTQDEILMSWQKAKDVLANAKEDEMSWRKYVVKRAFPDAKEGTNITELGNGYTLKANVKYNYRLLSNDVVESCLDRIRKIGNQGSFIADRLVSWTPSFFLTEYRSLMELTNESDSQEAKDILRIVHEMLEISDAAPTVEIKAPKVKK